MTRLLVLSTQMQAGRWKRWIPCHTAQANGLLGILYNMLWTQGVCVCAVQYKSSTGWVTKWNVFTYQITPQPTPLHGQGQMLANFSASLECTRLEMRSS